ncbi:hypothetical protein [Tumebacillus permanentifrigoris]|uniref:Uncharacterized protein n=1 Tax=Tumebacillus permanentifrigoris TaxID=378543 RepID=A0A316D995_9BACL|nr:hypothetical protein [Tumebacillus permanentifrigoris]PWK13738.1 hypothetical protein C7459_10616 [Tumebacillus permanentifrigoris]
MHTNRIAGLVRQKCWGVGHYRDPQPILDCMEQVLTELPYSTEVDVMVANWQGNGCHIHTKVLVKIGSEAYPVILSETCEPDVLAFTQNDIIYLLAAVVEETEEGLSKLMTAGAQITDSVAWLLHQMEPTEALHDTHHLETRE